MCELGFDMNHTITSTSTACPECAAPLRAPQARFCSAACKQRAYRRKAGAESVTVSDEPSCGRTVTRGLTALPSAPTAPAGIAPGGDAVLLGHKTSSAGYVMPVWNNRPHEHADQRRAVYSPAYAAWLRGR